MTHDEDVHDLDSHPLISYGANFARFWFFLIDYVVVILCACRDHILRGILSFLSIPFYVILPRPHEELLQWKPRGVGKETVIHCENQ